MEPSQTDPSGRPRPTSRPSDASHPLAGLRTARPHPTRPHPAGPGNGRPRNARLRGRGLLAGAATALLVAAIGAAGAVWHANAAQPPLASGWNLTWYDDFEGATNAPPASSNWIFDTGHSYPGGPANWGTGEIQTYTSAAQNVSLDGAGNLRITPVRDGSGNWTSARIESVRSDFKPPAGGAMRIEGSLRLPAATGAAGAGYWPAFWALGAPYRGNYQNWPGIGELDVMENVNGLNKAWGTLHCGVAPDGPCKEFNGLGSSRECPGSSCQSAFHTYLFEWDASVSPNVLRWSVDGVVFHTVSQSQVGEPYWSQMASHAGYFLLLNVAMGGSFPDGVAGGTTPTAATVSGQPMLVDYVRVYTRGGGTGSSSGATSSSGTTPPTSSSSGASGRRNAYATIEAESFDAQQGTQPEATSDTGGGQDLGWLANGDYARYDGVDFGSSAARTFSARVASGAASGISGLVEVRLDDVNSSPIGSFAIANTGGWQTWRTVPANIAGTTGVHTVFLRFTSGQPADFVNLNWFTFTH